MTQGNRMSEKYLREKEFVAWKDNHFTTLCKETIEIKTDVKWLKWVNRLAFVMLLGLLVKSFF